MIFDQRKQEVNIQTNKMPDDYISLDSLKGCIKFFSQNRLFIDPTSVCHYMGVINAYWEINEQQNLVISFENEQKIRCMGIIGYQNSEYIETDIRNFIDWYKDKLLPFCDIFLTEQ